jgi:hypothetical protein
MATSTAIEWTDTTWNPVTGCTKISAGCDNCYAERLSERFRGVPGHPFENGFDLQLRPERLEQPLQWREAKMIFVNSMSDLFHKQVPSSFPRKRESRGGNAAALAPCSNQSLPGRNQGAGSGPPLSRRFRGGDDNPL